MKTVNVLAIQKKTYADPEQNLEAVRKMTELPDGSVPDFIVLPEIFTCPYDNRCFPAFAEKEGGRSYRFLSALAREKGAYVVGGSVPERDGDRIYNTSYVFDRAER